ncbi:hypothetical protein GF374_03105 [Candidatus Woesearchaeota archaeon]|nr:hypothetical protein [Candidatus Woesearchaeota archaeon]
MDKWCGSVYEIQGKYPSTLTLTTLKSLVLADEIELFKKTKNTINNTFQDRFNLNINSTGTREISKGHQSQFITYNGIDIQNNQSIKVIGEVWNCASAGISIICIGFSYITNKEFPEIINIDNWKKIVMDPKGTIDDLVGDKGLIYNINCH